MQMVVRIKDDVTHRQLDEVKLISPYFFQSHGFGAKRLVIDEKTMKRVRKLLNSKNSDLKKMVETFKLNEVDTSGTFKSTILYKNTMNREARANLDSKLTDNKTDYTLAKQGLNEYEFNNGHFSGNNIDVFNSIDTGNDYTRKIIYYNPSKKQAIKELKWRISAIKTYIPKLKSDDNIDNSLKPKKLSDIRIILNQINNDLSYITTGKTKDPKLQDDYDKKYHGYYSTDIIKKYRELDGNASFSKKDTAKRSSERKQQLSDESRVFSNREKMLKLIQRISSITLKLYADILSYRQFMYKNLINTNDK